MNKISYTTANPIVFSFQRFRCLSHMSEKWSKVSSQVVPMFCHLWLFSLTPHFVAISGNEKRQGSHQCYDSFDKFHRRFQEGFYQSKMLSFLFWEWWRCTSWHTCTQSRTPWAMEQWISTSRWKPQKVAIGVAAVAIYSTGGLVYPPTKKWPSKGGIAADCRSLNVCFLFTGSIAVHCEVVRVQNFSRWFCTVQWFTSILTVDCCVTWVPDLPVLCEMCSLTIQARRKWERLHLPHRCRVISHIRWKRDPVKPPYPP